MINPVPVATATASSTTPCQGDAVTLSATGGTSYLWSPAAGLSSATSANPTFTASATTTYTVTVTNAGGCTGTASVTVNVGTNPIANAGGDKIYFTGQPALTLDGSSNSTSYYWTTSPASAISTLSSTTVLKPTVIPTENTVYTLHASADATHCGAEVTSSATVTVYKNVTIPNTFTPNNDGINDTWVIAGLNTYQNSVTQIFNRNGTLLFKSIGYPKSWDGKYGDRDVPAGSYYYVIDLNVQGLKFSGWLLVVR